ncbi:MAG: D-glycerate dehydrogenase [Chloroflexota bacterium]
MSTKPKVYIIVHIEDDLKEKIRASCDVAEIDATTSREELHATIHDAEGILLTPRVRADATFFDAAPNLKVISTTSVGYDPFDIPEATKHGVVVCHTPGVLSAAVANLTMALIFNVTLRLFDNEAYVRSGGWARREKPPALGHDIQGQTLGVIGFGRIGQEVTRRMQALGMKTIWYDVFETPHPDAPPSERRSLDELLAEADFVSLHTNLDASSRHLIGEAELAKMKPTAYLINTARGPLVDQKALTNALQNGIIAGAGLDVLEAEPPAEDDPIYTLPNVICFPHIGTATEETRRAMRELAVENLLAVLAGKRPPTPVNPEVLQ